jgi:hypothetical protein
MSLNTALSLQQPERTNLYINNINSDNKNEIELLIKDGLISCKNEEDFYISVVGFNTLYSFYQVIDNYNNQFNVIHNNVKTSYKIPYGNININTIIDYFNSIKNETDIIITYDKIKNKFNFQKQNQHHDVILEIVNCHSLLGFRTNETLITLPEHHLYLTSSIPINVMSITNIFIHLDAGYDLSIAENNFDNHNMTDKTIKTNNIICAIPVRECYNGIISYTNPDATTSFCFKANKQEIVQNLRLSIRDQYDKKIPIGDCYVILQLTKRLNKNPMFILFEEIKTYLLQILLLISSFFT